jgi:exodeoxyribonuclease-5
MKLTLEQSHAIKNLIKNKSNNQVQTLGGYAGCGKTTCLASLSRKLRKWRPCAFTGRAAHVMRSKGMKSARTIHSLIYNPVVEKGSVRYELRSRDELGDVQGFLADEASQIGKPLYDDLLSFDLPMILVGDHGQLPPVA